MEKVYSIFLAITCSPFNSLQGYVTLLIIQFKILLFINNFFFTATIDRIVISPIHTSFSSLNDIEPKFDDAAQFIQTFPFILKQHLHCQQYNAAIKCQVSNHNNSHELELNFFKYTIAVRTLLELNMDSYDDRQSFDQEFRVVVFGTNGNIVTGNIALHSSGYRAHDDYREQNSRFQVNFKPEAKECEVQLEAETPQFVRMIKFLGIKHITPEELWDVIESKCVCHRKVKFSNVTNDLDFYGELCTGYTFEF